MTTIVWLGLILIAMAITEACSDKPRGGIDFLHLMHSGLLVQSKKQTGRAQQHKRR